MPQLDSFIVTSQFNILIVFIVGFLLFKYHVLPVISIFYKIDTKLLNSKYGEFYKVSSYLTKNIILYETVNLILINLAILYKFYGDNQKKHRVILNFLETEHDVESISK